MENNQNQNDAFSHHKGKRSSRLPILIISVLLIGGTVFGLSRFIDFNSMVGVDNGTSVLPSVTPLPTQPPLPTEIIESPTPEVTATPTLKPQATINPVDKATGLDRSELSVEVQNGSGVVGAASKTSDFLKDLGYHVVSIGNANNYNYEDVSISVKSSASKYLQLLKTDLAKQYTISSSSADLSASSSADVIVIVGK